MCGERRKANKWYQFYYFSRKRPKVIVSTQFSPLKSKLQCVLQPLHRTIYRFRREIKNRSNVQNVFIFFRRVRVRVF